MFLTENGIIVDGISHKFSIFKIICDAPAKAFLLSTKGHGGFSSHPKCTVVGEYFENRVCFPGIGDAKRSDEDFLKPKNEDNQLTKCLLEVIPGIKLVTCVPSDYMHLICLGVVKKLTQLWLKGSLNVRLGHRVIEQISTKLEEVGKIFVPTEFVRKPRSLQYVKL